ncbi:MAG: alkyl hydroperoxide reductase [Rickettsiales bacterium]|nr:alkyl hydroperoxide reductase [Rickettsiales bacterium]
MTISVGDTFPSFELKAVDGKPFADINIDNVFVDVTDKSYAGKWLVVFFYPKDFTFVCPTEIAAFGDLNEEFEDRDAQVLAGSTDSEFVHWAWRKHQDELRDLPFPMLADVKRELTSALGILDKNEGVAQRATFIVDPDGIVRFSMVTDLNVGRNPKEVLRILDALQTDELCPCNWSKGEETIDLQEATADAAA